MTNKIGRTAVDARQPQWKGQHTDAIDRVVKTQRTVKFAAGKFRVEEMCMLALICAFGYLLTLRFWTAISK
jgi:hypothetical protein